MLGEEQSLSSPPADDLRRIFNEEIDTAALAARRGQKIYRSVKNLSQLIGGEYGDRVLYELIQNAHDAHPEGQPGSIHIRLKVESDTEGTLYVANGGRGFDLDNVQAIRNIATSTKEIGEGIGNKGIGFRSVEALTDTIAVYSKIGSGSSSQFDGFCFRFATPEETAERAYELGFVDEAEIVAKNMPRYLAAVPVKPPTDVDAFARRGFVTVVELPLRTGEAVKLARQQLDALIESDAPVLLFLDRIKRLELELELPDAPKRRVTLTRKSAQFRESVPKLEDCWLETVTLGPKDRRWLLLRRTLDPKRIREAVQRSIPHEKLLEQWLEWKGKAIVSLALPVDGPGLRDGRLYTFLPMGPESLAPTKAHLDAPFFTSIDRRRAKLELPLNAELLDAVAELAAAGSLILSERHQDLARRLMPDLAAWNVADWSRLSQGFESVGVAWADAPIWPTIDGGWASAKSIRLWPDGKYKVLTARKAAIVAAAHLLRLDLSKERTATIAALAKAAGLSIHASPAELVNWATKIAAVLPARPSSRRAWSDFYADLALALPSLESLRLCKDQPLMLGRDELLHPASTDFYVRQEGVRRGKSAGAPPPPPELARKIKLLADGITLKPETFAAFERAQLCKRYDATEVLRRLESLFGARPAPGRRAAALLWAFQVWQLETASAKEALKHARLQVPVRTGWTPAYRAAFSESWTSLGRALELFLTEATEAQDCDASDALKHLLIPWIAWPEQSGRVTRAEWIRFLVDAGVGDGLVPIAQDGPAGPLFGQAWSSSLAGSAREGDADWRTEMQSFWLDHPYTAYTRSGAIWRLPGQAVVAALSHEARRSFASLALRHLNVHADNHLTFKVGRFERSWRDQAVREAATPMRSFLATASWVPIVRRGAERFTSVGRAWLMTDRRNDPRFVARVTDDMADLLNKEGQAFKVLSQPLFGLKVWKEPATAQARLKKLAQVCGDLEVHDRAPFRKQSDMAWRDAIEAGLPLSKNLPLILDQSTGFSRLAGSTEKPNIFVRTGRDRSLAKLLIDTHNPVLLTGDEVDATAIIRLINDTGRFDARPVDASDVRLLVDGEPFAVQLQDPLLVDVAPWLLDAMVLAHELGARELERSITASSLESQLSRIRLRACDEIRLQTANGGERALDRHLARDEVSPTLIVCGCFDRNHLRDSASLLTPFIHTNLRTFEPMLLRLSFRLPDGLAVSEMPAPSVDDLAFATESDSALVEEALHARRHDRTRQARLLLPVAAYFRDAEAAVALRDSLLESSYESWPLQLAILGDADLANQLIVLSEQTDDLAVVRQTLNLNYARFNRALKSVGMPTLANEAELRRQFDLWKSDLREPLLERIRRHFSANWRDLETLARYATLRDLNFIAFDDAWVEEIETLDRETVREHASQILDELLGPALTVDLPASEALRASNRKLIANFAAEHLEVVRAASGNGIPRTWSEGPHEVAAAADRTGALDFERLEAKDVIPVLVLTGQWPIGMKPTVTLSELGLSPEDLNREARAAAEAAAEEKRRRDSINFAGSDFDTSTRQFAAEFGAVALERFGNSGWRSRSSIRTAPLRDMGEPTGSGGGGSGGGGRASPKPPEHVRAAMGLAGEILAYQYLKTKHSKLFHDGCWVSCNRRSLFPEEGNDKLGYDFAVNSTETEWVYEVKATPGEACEFELTDNEYRTAAAAAADKGRRYRILMVQYVFDPTRCRVIELPNPVGPMRSKFRTVGRSSARMRFELGSAH